MTALLDLPQELVASIYSLLPDAASKQAFFSSCSAVWRNTSVLALLTQLSISRDQLHSSISPLACLPRGVQLQSLTIEGSDWKELCLDDGLALLNLFRTREGASRARVQSVIQCLRKLKLIGCIILSSSMASEVGRTVGSLPLATLTVNNPRSGVPASFFKGLSASVHSTTKLQVLTVDLGSLHRSHIHAIGQLTGLRTLVLALRGSSWTLQQLAPLGSLRHVKKLVLEGDLTSTVSPSEAYWLSMLPCLEALHVDAMPAGVIEWCPPSLQQLSINMADVDCLSALASVVGNFPNLQSLHLVNFSCGNSAWGAVVPALSAMLSVRPQLRIVTVNVHVGAELVEFMDACQHVPVFANGVKGLIMDVGLHADTCLRLSAMCGSLEHVTFMDIETSDMICLSHILKMLGPRLVAFTYVETVPPPGIAAVILPLIFETALSSPAPVSFRLYVKAPGADAEVIQDELDLLNYGWYHVASATLHRLLAGRTVSFEARVL